MYPAKVIKLDNGRIITFKDIPEATAWVGDNEDIRKAAERSLLIAVEIYADGDRIVPNPSEKEDDEILISLPASVVTKVLLLNTMIEQRVSQVKLADLMGVPRQQITRLVDLKHTTKLDALQKTLNFLGKELTITLSSHPNKQPLVEDSMNTANQNIELNLPDEIRLTSTIEKLCRIKREQTEKPNPFTRLSQYEIIRLLTDDLDGDVGKSKSISVLIILTPILTYLTRNSSLEYEPSIYEHHFNLVELERLAYNCGNSSIPTRPIEALKDFLLALPDYDINKIGNQSGLTNEAFGFLVMQLIREINKYS